MRLATETSEVLPGYVREARAVVGAQGLRRMLDEAARGTASDPRIEAAQRTLEQREEKLHRRAQEVTRREDDLAAAQSDLDAREQELDRRAAELAAREESLAQEILLLKANTAALTARDTLLRARAEELARIEERARDSSIVAREEGARVRSGSGAPDADEEALAPSDEPSARRSREGTSRDGAMEVDIGDLAESPATPEAPRTLREQVLQVDASDLLDDTHGAAERPERPYAAVVESEVRMWFHASPEVAQQLAAGGVVPVLQADPDGTLPLATLTLRRETGAPIYARIALDLTRPEDRAVVESLSRDFRVHAEVVSVLGHALGSTALGAPCEQNAQRVLALLSARSVGTAQQHREALTRLAAEGISWSPPSAASIAPHDDPALTTAHGVEAALDAYAGLLDRATLDRFVVARGYSTSQIDSFGKRLALAALRCGVVPSPSFVARALELGVAPDEKSFVVRALTAFARTVEGGVTAIGRSPSSASRAWGPLLAWAARVGVSIPETARGAIASVYDPDDPDSVAPPDPRAAPTPEAYASMIDADLVGWISHQNARLPAARELARRDASRNEAAIGRALKMLPGPEAALLAEELVRGGDAIGDVWVELLGSRRRAVAAIGTAAAGVLKLRRALGPLVQRALARDNVDWRLAAWAAGEFGVAAVRAVARTETDEVERLAWVVGHAIRCGAAREVERIRGEATRAFQEAAGRALSLQDELRTWHETLRQGDEEPGKLIAPVLRRGDGAAHESRTPA
jgi:hypothetical protein